MTHLDNVFWNTGLFFIVPVVLKVNTTKEAYPMKKGLYLDGFP